MAIEWSDEALNAIERLSRRIGELAGELAAAGWRERLVARVELAEFLPYASRVVPEFGVETFREVFEGDYRILYRIVPGGIEVATVFHGALQIGD